MTMFLCLLTRIILVLELCHQIKRLSAHHKMLRLYMEISNRGNFSRYGSIEMSPSAEVLSNGRQGLINIVIINYLALFDCILLFLRLSLYFFHNYDGKDHLDVYTDPKKNIV